jgi:hypothetical protein
MKNLFLLLVISTISIFMSAAQAQLIEGTPVPKSCQLTLDKAIAPTLLKLSKKTKFKVFRSSQFKINYDIKNYNVNFELSYDMGNKNYCLNSGYIEVEINENDCKFINLMIESNNFDCG